MKLVTGVNKAALTIHIFHLDTSDYVKFIYRQTLTQESFSQNKIPDYLNLSVSTTLDVQPLHPPVPALTPAVYKPRHVSIIPYLFQSMNSPPPSIFHPQ